MLHDSIQNPNWYCDKKTVTTNQINQVVEAKKNLNEKQTVACSSNQSNHNQRWRRIRCMKQSKYDNCDALHLPAKPIEVNVFSVFFYFLLVWIYDSSIMQIHAQADARTHAHRATHTYIVTLCCSLLMACKWYN